VGGMPTSLARVKAMLKRLDREESYSHFILKTG